MDSRKNQAKRDCNFLYLYKENAGRQTYKNTQPKNVKEILEEYRNELSWSHSPKWEC